MYNKISGGGKTLKLLNATNRAIIRVAAVIVRRRRQYLQRFTDAFFLPLSVPMLVVEHSQSSMIAKLKVEEGGVVINLAEGLKGGGRLANLRKKPLKNFQHHMVEIKQGSLERGGMFDGHKEARRCEN